MKDSFILFCDFEECDSNIHEQFVVASFYGLPNVTYNEHL